MQLLKTILRQHTLAFIAIILLNLLSAGLGIAIISWINHGLLGEHSLALGISKMLGLLILLLATTLGAQWSLTTLGHQFIWRKRSAMVWQMMNTPIATLEAKGEGELLALLGPDIRNITLAFVRLPELIQGILLSLVAIGYLGYLSVPVLLITIAWLIATFTLGYKMVSKVYQHIAQVRDYESDLQSSFQVVIQGRKELALNPARARHFYETHYQTAALGYKQNIVKADSYHLSAINWSNIMMLGLIGVIFLLAETQGWISMTVATSFSLTILFLRTPLLQAIGAYPTLLSGELAFKKINELLPNTPLQDDDTETANVNDNWQQLRWEAITWQYPEKGFQVGPLSMTVTRGETIFIIGANGSGKSTLSLLLTGLYPMAQGRAYCDDQSVSSKGLMSLFSVVFTKPYLFDTVFLEPSEADHELATEWLARLQLDNTITINHHQLSTLSLSAGQSKRVALLLAMAEKRDILFLDEWAAEQDPQFRRYFYRELLPWLKQLGKTLLIISHDDDYFDVADRVYEMQQGHLRLLSAEESRQAARAVISQS
ncbi:multidrug ABC transporter permease/ATP-binding protein [Rosenbergiella sp. S61]|uniref:ABC-type xenobiotic transporter n=1 Tax=Rosenbergiella gaditana TaxID=2726987 RepID=A0ABS5ST84_9GAMM|nr:multidrug ABC transporter permease/ATP-binding protein [Rosenbergiella gaditana]MBT0723134.1 multidrug ABC transporter permease/ATP-binding protein [Rosenbergiella gaditana]